MQKKKVKSIFKISCCAVILFTLFSCESSHISFDDQGTFVTDTIGAFDTIYFASDVFPVLKNNCGSCHFAGTDLDLESYGMYDVLINGSFIDLDNPENSGLFMLLDPGHADDYLTLEEHTLIIKWIQQGAINN